LQRTCPRRGLLRIRGQRGIVWRGVVAGKPRPSRDSLDAESLVARPRNGAGSPPGPPGPREPAWEGRHQKHPHQGPWRTPPPPGEALRAKKDPHDDTSAATVKAKVTASAKAPGSTAAAGRRVHRHLVHGTRLQFAVRQGVPGQRVTSRQNRGRHVWELIRGESSSTPRIRQRPVAFWRQAAHRRTGETNRFTKPAPRLLGRPAGYTQSHIGMRRLIRSSVLDGGLRAPARAGGRFGVAEPVDAHSRQAKGQPRRWPATSRKPMRHKAIGGAAS